MHWLWRQPVSFSDTVIYEFFFIFGQTKKTQNASLRFDCRRSDALLPVINYLRIKKYYNISGSGFRWMTVMGTADLIFLAVPCIIGIGLLSVKKWVWWSLLFYASALTINNTIALFRNQDIFHLSALLQTLVGIALILFFLRKDISTPYFKMYPRGWRGQKRTPIVMDVILDGTLYKTKDISYARQFRRGRFLTCPTGLYAEWIGCTKNLGDAEMDDVVGTHVRSVNDRLSEK